MKEHRFMNKVDFTLNPSDIPNNNTGNLKLYYLFSLVKESYASKENDPTVGLEASLFEHLKYYKMLLNEFDKRNLNVLRKEKDSIERAIHRVNNPSKSEITHCPKCGSVLFKTDLTSFTCGECHGRLPGYSLNVMQKPFRGFKDWDDCIAHMIGQGHDEESAKKICGKLQSEEGEK